MPVFHCWVWQELEKGQAGLIFTDGQRFVLEELGNSINRLVDKSQTENSGNPLSQTSGNLSVQYPWPSASLPHRRYENRHMIAITNISHCADLQDPFFFLVNIFYLLLWPLFPRLWLNFLLKTLGAGDMGAQVKMKSGISTMYRELHLSAEMALWWETYVGSLSSWKQYLTWASSLAS